MRLLQRRSDSHDLRRQFHLFFPKSELIDEFVASMQQQEPQQYVLEDLGDVTSYLGLNIAHNKAVTITLTKPYLIYKIIKSAGFKQ